MIRTAQSTFKHSSKISSSYALKNLYQKPVVQVSTALVLTIFAIVFFGVFAIRPTLSTIAELIKKIEAQREVVEKLNKKTSALATAQSEYLLVESKLPLVASAIPSDHGADVLLKQIEASASQLNLPLTSIQVDSISLPPDPENTQMIEGVVQLPLSIGIEAPYSSLRQLLDLVANLKRFITVESISFTINDGSTRTQSQDLRMNLQVFAYYLPEEKAVE